MVNSRRLDMAVAGVVAVLGQQEAWAPRLGFSQSDQPAVAFALTALITAVALLWRRIAPFLVVVVVSAVLSADFLLYSAPDGLAVLLPPLLAFYAAGRYGTEARFWAALVLTAASTAVHEWRDPRYVWDGRTMTFWAILLVGGLLGRVFQSRAAQLRDADERATHLEAERDEQARLAATHERARLAAELHDIVGHGLTLLVVQLVAAQGSLERGLVEPTRQRLELIEAIVRGTQAEMRRLVDVLGEGDSPLTPLPGITEIDALVERVRADGVAVELTCVGTPTAVGAGIGLAAYRVVQEGLTNVIKHARPPVARVIVAFDGSALTVEVIDEGHYTVASNGVGRGLAGMRERVTLYGGVLQAGWRPEGGFGVRASFPLEGAA